MITATALKSARYLSAIRLAILAAVRASHAGARPAAAVWVNNRRGEPSIYAQAARGKHVRLYDLDGKDITARIMMALQTWHAQA